MSISRSNDSFEKSVGKPEYFCAKGADVRNNLLINKADTRSNNEQIQTKRAVLHKNQQQHENGARTDWRSAGLKGV